MVVDSPMDGRAELEADIAELASMMASAKRANVRRELQRVLDTLQAELARTAGVATSSAAPPAATPAPAALPAATPAPAAPVAATPAPAAAAPAAAPKPVVVAHTPAPVHVKAAGPWTEITTFSQDLGGYDKPHVTVDVRLKGVEALPKDSVTCDFTESSFDLKVVGLDGVNYRFLRTNLDKDIVPGDSSVRVKKNHVIVTLQKVKGQYGYDSWTDLLAKGGRRKEKKKDEKPQDSIMSMMKDLYDDGDDNMKKVIGEAMYKAQRGEKYEPKSSDLGGDLGGLGGGMGDGLDGMDDL